MDKFQQKREDLGHKTFILMLKIAILFGIPAAVAFFAGRALDSAYDMRPKGTLICLGVSFIFSWIIVIREYKKISQQFKQIDREEQAEKEKMINEVKQNLGEEK